ncbi:hypothetical protein DCS_07736 [Drechmeria coniospora]|uniref:Cytokinesis regulator n=1 Tax=Drechmeria coniospora TaxID=98403 RepID=A0A151GFE0_DRECN|nr:hypothetical protein DCS_07736 [Drechmeria coniospora]KYK55772.1 hypothetical protein DCS_07736 [Drechmeria coniospora]
MDSPRQQPHLPAPTTEEVENWDDDDLVVNDDNLFLRSSVSTAMAATHAPAPCLHPVLQPTKHPIQHVPAPLAIEDVESWDDEDLVVNDDNLFLRNTVTTTMPTTLAPSRRCNVIRLQSKPLPTHLPTPATEDIENWDDNDLVINDDNLFLRSSISNTTTAHTPSHRRNTIRHHAKPQSKRILAPAAAEIENWDDDDLVVNDENLFLRSSSPTKKNTAHAPSRRRDAVDDDFESCCKTPTSHPVSTAAGALDQPSRTAPPPHHLDPFAEALCQVGESAIGSIQDMISKSLPGPIQASRPPPDPTQAQKAAMPSTMRRYRHRRSRTRSSSISLDMIYETDGEDHFFDHGSGTIRACAPHAPAPPAPQASLPQASAPQATSPQAPAARAPAQAPSSAPAPAPAPWAPAPQPSAIKASVLQLSVPQGSAPQQSIAKPKKHSPSPPSYLLALPMSCEMTAKTLEADDDDYEAVFELPSDGNYFQLLPGKDNFSSLSPTNRSSPVSPNSPSLSSGITGESQGRAFDSPIKMSLRRLRTTAPSSQSSIASLRTPTNLSLDRPLSTWERLSKPKSKQRLAEASSRETEPRFLKQPLSVGSKGTARAKGIQVISPDRTWAPPPPTPLISAKPTQVPHYARDTVASRTAREITRAQRAPSSGPLAPVTAQREAHLATRANLTLYPRPPQQAVYSRKHSKRPKQLKPHLIANLNSSKESKGRRSGPLSWLSAVVPCSNKQCSVVNGMVFNADTLCWEGNENALNTFDKAPTHPPRITPMAQHLVREKEAATPPRPALISNISATTGIRVVGGMVFDPEQMCWLKAGSQSDTRSDAGDDMDGFDAFDDEDVFKNITDLDEKSASGDKEEGWGSDIKDDWPVGEEFDVGPEFVRREREEEANWRKISEKWAGRSQRDQIKWRWAIRDILAQ